MTDGLRDIIADRLDVLFCGINPGLKAAATGHHFAGRGNRFWRTIHLAGFTPQEIAAEEADSLLRYGCGLTAFVERPTARADQLLPQEFEAAAADFQRKIARYVPRFVAFLGKAAYAGLIGSRQVEWGRQADPIGASVVWVLPNPSGRNLAFHLDQLVEAYRDLHRAAF
jgi:TDG/mug DNA glycosylase family protein